MLVDTHCHIHDASYPLDPGGVIKRAHQAGVGKMICVGTSIDSSHDAVAFSHQHDGIYASIGVHPHDTQGGISDIATLATDKKVVAVGEIGLDYYYNHSPRDIQIAALEQQLQLAIDYNLPVIFHVREAFNDFWPIFDNFSNIRGVLHSFTDTLANVEQALRRELYIGVNGISTFTRDPAQRQMFASIPTHSMLIETDAPYLTPAPFRGKINEPALAKAVAEYHAKIRDISVEEITSVTTANATALFAL